MSDAIKIALEAIDEEHAEESALTRRKLVGAGAASLGSLGLLGLIGDDAWAARASRNDPQTILNVAATAEVLATIVNTVGPEKLGARLDPVTTLNVQAAAREELIHYNVLVASGGKPLTKRIWVPDAVFASREGLLTTLEAGDQIFINAYLIGTTAFARAKQAKLARFTGEFMGAEAVHRALARQSLGKLGNDRAFMRYDFSNILTAVSKLKKAGFGFGTRGATPGQFYEVNEVRRRTPNPAGVNTRKPR